MLLRRRAAAAVGTHLQFTVSGLRNKQVCYNAVVQPGDDVRSSQWPVAAYLLGGCLLAEQRGTEIGCALRESHFTATGFVTQLK